MGVGPLHTQISYIDLHNFSSSEKRKDFDCKPTAPCCKIILVLPLTRWWDRPPKFFFFAISGAQTQGTQLFRCRTTLLAVSWAADGVRGRLNVPSHLTLPCASIGYLKSALQRAPAELGLSTRCKFSANFLQISCKFWGDAGIGHYTSPPSTPGALIMPTNASVSCLWPDGQSHQHERDNNGCVGGGCWGVSGGRAMVFSQCCLRHAGVRRGGTRQST